MTGQEKVEARKEKILETATKVFAKKGFQETTISEVATMAGVSEATVYEYFTTKEGLLFSIPLKYMEELRQTARFHLKLIRGAANKIRALSYMQILFYKENRDFAAVLMLILKQNRKFLDTEAHKSIRSQIKIYDQILQEGIDTGEFRSDIDLYLLRSSSIGALEHMVTNWLMMGYPDIDAILSMVDPMIDTLICGIQKRKENFICPLEILSPRECTKSDEFSSSKSIKKPGKQKKTGDT